jgi:molecular chaperone DnaK
VNNYIGIDLGTTNSVISSYNGVDTRIWKSPEQNDVTPSVIYIDKRGNKYIGKRAYDSAPLNPDNSAMLFKRLMGTNTHINLANISKSPEECSSEILKVLFGYLPEEIRNDSETGTVITVPAAFNQMQKDATMQAANLAGIGNVALMQEPVAAVMSVMRVSKLDGIFLIFDLGGGTLDIAIAESIKGRVNLLAHGGIAMCGGRDFDRIIVDNIVKPWLMDNFDLPTDLSANPVYKTLLRLSTWATEKSKIELSSVEDTRITLTESEARIRDLDNNEIFLDIELSRDSYNKLIDDLIDESIDAARETLKNAGIQQESLDRIVFIGGPTNYKPLRDKVSFQLGVKGNVEINPMTAVAEGASVFAESIDWQTKYRLRKESRAKISLEKDIQVSFNYPSRTPDTKAKIALQVKYTPKTGSEYQIDSLDTGWSSGRMPLVQGASIEVELPKQGENSFKIIVYNSKSRPITLENDLIKITKTAATIDAIPASHSVGIEVLDKVGGISILDYIVHKGDSLPKKVNKIFKAAESLKSGSHNSLNFKLWEGDIEDPITDNRPIGSLKISGLDFDHGVIPAGANLECQCDILDSGNIILEVSVPAIGGTFNSGKNFYSRQDGQLDFSGAADYVIEEAEITNNNVDEISDVVDDPRLDQVYSKLDTAHSLDPDETDPELTQKAMDDVYEARRILAKIRKDNRVTLRQVELDRQIDTFNSNRDFIQVTDQNSFDNLVKLAKRAIDLNNNDFNVHISEMQQINFGILWRQDQFVIQMFKYIISKPTQFNDKAKYERLIKSGHNYLNTNQIDNLRNVIFQLKSIQKPTSSKDDIFDIANIVRG